MRNLIFFFLFLAGGLSAQISITASDLPDDANIPSVAALSSSNPSKAYWTMYLDATTYDNANDSTAFAALGAAVKTEIDSNYVEDIFGINPAADVVMRTVITYVRRQWDAFEFLDLSSQYLADEDVFKVSGYCEWEISAP